MAISAISQVTPAWLTGILQAQGHPVTIDEVTITAQKESHVAVVYWLAVTYAGDAGAAPPRLFLKLPKRDFAWTDREIGFYRRVVPAMRGEGVRLPFIVPVRDVEHDTGSGHAHLLMDDLSASHYHIDEAPPHDEHLIQVIDSLALLHAFWWESQRLGRDIGTRLDDATISGFEMTCRQRLDDYVAHVDQPVDPMLVRAVDHWPPLRRARVLAGQGITVVHRDTHPRNFLYPRDPDGHVIIIDWEGWRIDTGTDDLAYMMAGHWDIDQRIRLEMPLLEHYYETLCGYGVRNYSWDDCFYDYQASIVRCLSFLVTAWSPAQMQTPVWTKRVTRTLRAFHDFDCAAIL